MGRIALTLAPPVFPSGTPDSGEERRSDDANRLAEDLSRVSCTDAVLEHQPMHLNVADRESLAEDVGALQVVKCARVIAALRGFAGTEDLGVERIV